jgi:hypothetical protein
MVAFDAEVLEELDRLHELRRQAREMCRDAFEVILENGEVFCKDKNDLKNRFDLAEDHVEEALTLKAINIYLQRRYYSVEKQRDRDKKKGKATDIHAKLVKSIAAIECATNPDANLGAFRAARVLYALASAPGMAYSKASMLAFAFVIDELYQPRAPEYRTGGAAARSDNPDSAFVTADCTRAIAALARATQRTARLADSMARIADRNTVLNELEQHGPKKWVMAERERLLVTAVVLLAAVSRKALLDLDSQAVGTLSARNFGNDDTKYDSYVSSMSKLQNAINKIWEDENPATAVLDMPVDELLQLLGQHVMLQVTFAKEQTH